MSVWKVLHLTCMYISGSPQFLSVLGVNPKDCQETAVLPGSTKVASYRIGCGGSRNVQTVLLTACFDLSRLPSPSMFSFSGFSESFLHIVVWGSCWRLAALNEANRKALVFSLQCLDSSSGSGLSCSLKPGLELWPLLGNRSQSFPLKWGLTRDAPLTGYCVCLVICDFKFKTDWPSVLLVEKSCSAF